MNRNRRGFSLVELLIALLIIATLTGAALPNLNRALLRARGVDAVADPNAVKVAVLNYQADNTTWPPDRNRGVIPPGLGPYLPEGFSFDKDDYVLDYDNWTESVGFVGVTLVTDDRDLLLMVLDLLGTSNTWTNDADKVSWVIEWTD